MNEIGRQHVFSRRSTEVEPDGSGIVLSGCTVLRQGREVLHIPELMLGDHRIGVVGRNGSGKSTLARLICGLISPDQGEVHVGGVDMIHDRKSAIRAAGILFQNPDHQIIFPTVEEELAFGLAQLGVTKEDAQSEAHKMLEKFSKSHWSDRSIHTLSQGQRHLVCLMAVLVMDPRLIVLDEPFAGLDIPTTRAMTRYLKGLGQQILHITHDPEMLASYDRVLWLEQGRIEADGPPAEVIPVFRAAMEADDDRSDLAD